MSKFKEYIKIINEMISDEEASKNAKMMLVSANKGTLKNSVIENKIYDITVNDNQDYFGQCNIEFHNLPEEGTYDVKATNIKYGIDDRGILKISDIFFYRENIDADPIENKLQIAFSLSENTSTQKTFIYPYNEGSLEFFHLQLTERLKAKEYFKNKLAEKIMNITDVNANEIMKITIDYKKEIDDIIKKFSKQLIIEIIDFLKKKGKYA
jgi:hypothetical protein